MDLFVLAVALDITWKMFSGLHNHSLYLIL